LLVLAELQLVDIVLQVEFLEGDGDLVAVGGCSTGWLARNFCVYFMSSSLRSGNQFSKRYQVIAIG
jgi:hypothetical protein